MEAMYSIYGDDDLILLIPKHKERGEFLAKDVVEVVLEQKFELTDELEENYMVLAYNEYFDILNNGYMHFYQQGVANDFSNIVVKYDEEGNLKEIFLKKENINVPFYKAYSIEEVRNDIEEIIRKSKESFIEALKSSFKNSKLARLGLEYFYDGEAISINVVTATQEEVKSILAEGDDDSNLGNYKNRISLNEEAMNALMVLILSLRKDELTDEVEILKHIVGEINTNIKVSSSNKELPITDDFKILDIQSFD